LRDFRGRADVSGLPGLPGVLGGELFLPSAERSHPFYVPSACMSRAGNISLGAIR